MPRVVSLPKADQWKNVDFSGLDFTDQNLDFLVSFEEVLPGDISIQTLAKPKKKKDKQKKKEKMKAKKEKKAKAAASASASVDNKEEDVVAETLASDDKEVTTPDSQLEESLKPAPEKKKKTKTKRKSADKIEDKTTAKKVKFAEVLEEDEESTINAMDEESTMEKVDAENNISEKVEGADTEADISEWLPYNLPEEIMKALKAKKFTTPTEIQRMTLTPAVRDRLDILGAAETGSGKTLAFAIPVIARLLSDERVSNGPRALVIAPTRELVVQITTCFKDLCKFTPFAITPIVGGLADVKQLRIMAKRRPEIVVATPGRLWDLMQNAAEDSHLADFKGLQCVVIDETDRMVEQGHFAELKNILESVRSQSSFSADGKLQTLVFSATLTYVIPEKPTGRGTENKKKNLTDKEKIKFLMEATGMREKNKVIDVTRLFGTAEKLFETRLNCDGLLDKDTKIAYLLKRYLGRTLIFTNSVDASRRLYGVLTLLKFNPMMIHAGMIQRQRLRNLENFAKNKNSILLATDVAARGLDIQGIEHVIHYQVPKTAEMYIHRSGRTARASESGLTVLMVDPKDAYLYRKLCKNLNRDKDLPVFPIDAEDLEIALKHRVKLASDLDTLAHRAKKVNLEETWFAKTAHDAGLEIDDRDRVRANANDAYNDLLRKQDAVRYELNVELSQKLPDITRLNVPRTRYITPEVSAMYDKKVSTHALDDLANQLKQSEELKKKTRGKLKTHNVMGRKFKRK